MKTKLTPQEIESWKHSKKDYLIRPTAMKAEELKQKAFFGYDQNSNPPYSGKIYRFTESELDEYAQQVGRKKMEDSFKAGMVFQQFDNARDFDEWLEWYNQNQQ